jgi:hypothetical protein
MAATRKQLYDDAVAKLKDYIPGVSKEDFVSLLLNGGVEASANTKDTASSQATAALRDAMSPVVDLINGGAFTREVLDGLNSSITGAGESAAKLKSLARFTLSSISTTDRKGANAEVDANGLLSGARSFKRGGEQASISKSVPASGVKGHYTIDIGVPMQSDPLSPAVANADLQPSKAKPSIAVIELLNPRIGTAVRDTAGLSIFCSMIPAHIMSRAVPYMAVRVSTPDIISSGQDGTTRVKSLNLIRYLRGEQAYTPNDPVGMMIAFSSGSTVTPKSGGMELFTAPQTLVSDLSDINSATFGNYKPIDRFRPFMSLNDVSFEVVSAGAGMMSYKQASMSLTLHDRGRLSEISSFVKPGAYSTTEVEIEYGWSVDPRSSQASIGEAGLTGYATKDDVFSQFIDSLRVKEKYIVVNSTFQFDDAGQVNVSLTLSMKGASDMRSYDISGDIGKQAKTELKRVVEDIQKLIAQTGGRAESLFGETLMSAVSSTESALNLNEEELAKVRQQISKVKNSAQRKGDDFTQIQRGLDSIFKSTGGLQKQITGNTAVTTMLNSLASSTEIFPCCEETVKKGASNSKASLSAVLTSQQNAYANGSISLGKVLLAFVAKPLAASNQYDEIQLVFNKLNARAGFVRNLSMAAFPLDKTKLDKTMKELYTKNVTVSLSQLIAVLGADHIGNVAYPAYGFASAYNDKGEYQKVRGVEAQDYVDSQLLKAGIADCSFQQPQLSIVPECVPHKNFPEKTILRLHVTDGTCTPYQSYSDAVNAGRSDSAFFVDALALSTDQKLFKSIYWADLDPAEAGKLRTDEISKMRDAGVLKVVASTPTAAQAGTIESYQLDLTQLFTTGDPKVVKRFFSESLPVIRYGTAAGMVKNISVSSISDPQLATINILKQDESSSDSETSSRDKGLPLIVAPTEVSIDMLGCPIINFGQAAYIDFGTNTTIDNIYVCTNLSHKVTPGDFTTSAKFTLNVGAYGVYNSSKRSIDLTREMLKQIRGGGDSTTAVAAALTTVPDAKAESLIWGTDIGSGVTAAAIEAARKKHKVIIGLRCWSVTDAKGSYKAKLNDNTEILLSTSSKTSQALVGLEQAGVNFYEIPLPNRPSYADAERKKRNDVVTARRYGYSERDPAGAPVEVNLKSYYDEIEAIDLKARETKQKKK